MRPWLMLRTGPVVRPDPLPHVATLALPAEPLCGSLNLGSAA